MKHLIYSIILLSWGLWACKPSTSHQNRGLSNKTYDTVLVEDKTIIALKPDSIQLALLKKKYGETAFYTLVDDKVFYEAQLEEWAMAKGVKLLETKSRRIAIGNRNGAYELIEKDSLELQWTNYFYYTSDLGLVVSSLEELLEAFEPLKIEKGELRFILEKVSAKETPSFKETGIFELQPGEIVRAISEMKISGTLSGEESSCYDNTWIEVETNTGEQGWVYGRSIAMLQEKPALLPGYQGEELSIGGKSFRLGIIKNYSLGASDEEGLIGCPEYYPLIFFQEDFQNIRLAKLINSPHSDFPFCNLVADTKVSEKIDSLYAEKDKVILKISYSFQEGAGSYDLELKEVRGALIGEVKNLQELNEQ